MQHDSRYTYKLSKREQRHYRCLGLQRNGSNKWSPGGYLIAWEKIEGVFTGTVGSYKATGESLKEVLEKLRLSYKLHPEFRNEVFDHQSVIQSEELSG